MPTLRLAARLPVKFAPILRCYEGPCGAAMSRACSARFQRRVRVADVVTLHRLVERTTVDCSRTLRVRKALKIANYLLPRWVLSGSKGAPCGRADYPSP
jgi:hypothetical protein